MVAQHIFASSIKARCFLKAQTVFEEHGVIKHDLLAAGWVQSFVNHHFQYGFWKWGFGDHGDVNGNHHFPWFPWPKKRAIYHPVEITDPGH